MRSSTPGRSIPLEPDNGMHVLIIEEMESMLLEKELYDMEYPDHVKAVSGKEMWEIARSKVLSKLTDPTVNCMKICVQN